MRLGGKQVVHMYNNETTITSKDGVSHRFFYDHCFWSFDDNDQSFADQETVYRQLAQPLLDRAFEGYNTCLFAYGQVRRERERAFESLHIHFPTYRLDQARVTGRLSCVCLVVVMSFDVL